MRKILDRILPQVNSLESREINKGDIHVQIKKGEVYIDAPRRTMLHCACWYDDITKMSEDIMMGSDEAASVIRDLQDLQERIEALEKRI